MLTVWACCGWYDAQEASDEPFPCKVRCCLLVMMCGYALSEAWAQTYSVLHALHIYI